MHSVLQKAKDTNGVDVLTLRQIYRHAHSRTWPKSAKVADLPHPQV